VNQVCTDLVTATGWTTKGSFDSFFHSFIHSKLPDRRCFRPSFLFSGYRRLFPPR